jgi:glycosyltransferase involved in cell wall biosynthesis
MRVSIITIAYNSEETITDTIKSVLAQDYDQIEYIVIDGASRDKTMSIVRSYKDQISTIISEPDEGIYDAMNKGVKAATGDLIGILNSDDFYVDSKVVSDIVAALTEQEAEAIYADLEYVDRTATNKVIRHWRAGEYEPNAFRKGWMPPHPTFFLSHKAYREYGCYNTDLRSAADYELMLRMIHKHGVKLGYLPRVITKMRVGGQSNMSVKNRIKANIEDRLAWKLNGLTPGMFTLIMKPLSKIGQYLKR